MRLFMPALAAVALSMAAALAPQPANAIMPAPMASDSGLTEQVRWVCRQVCNNRGVCRERCRWRERAPRPGVTIHTPGYRAYGPGPMYPSGPGIDLRIR
jgi:hypothetical protein